MDAAVMNRESALAEAAAVDPENAPGMAAAMDQESATGLVAAMDEPLSLCRPALLLLMHMHRPLHGEHLYRTLD